jgi:hypothetical protein
LRGIDGDGCATVDPELLLLSPTSEVQMLEAHIVSPSGSLYFAGKPTAHDLESLRAHVRDFVVGTRDVRLDVCVTDAEWARLLASGWLYQLARAGAWVCRCPAEFSAPSASRRACA